MDSVPQDCHHVFFGNVSRIHGYEEVSPCTSEVEHALDAWLSWCWQSSPPHRTKRSSCILECLHWCKIDKPISVSQFTTKNVLTKEPNMWWQWPHMPTLPRPSYSWLFSLIGDHFPPSRHDSFHFFSPLTTKSIAFAGPWAIPCEKVDMPPSPHVKPCKLSFSVHWNLLGQGRQTFSAQGFARTHTHAPPGLPLWT